MAESIRFAFSSAASLAEVCRWRVSSRARLLRDEHRRPRCELVPHGAGRHDDRRRRRRGPLRRDEQLRRAWGRRRGGGMRSAMQRVRLCRGRGRDEFGGYVLTPKMTPPHNAATAPCDLKARRDRRASLLIARLLLGAGGHRCGAATTGNECSRIRMREHAVSRPGLLPPRRGARPPPPLGC